MNELELRSPFPPPTPIDPLLRNRPVSSDAPSAAPHALRARERPQVMRKRRDGRSKAVLLGLATVIGLWFGLAAPSVSPVTPARSSASGPAPSSSAASTSAGSTA
ncbi:MAG: hypothetical protein JWL72_801 [Ilumatobacteraceae bacterium]|nr:hypothetical protein [Ilumatobacteraceae bacterium]